MKFKYLGETHEGFFCVPGSILLNGEEYGVPRLRPHGVSRGELLTMCKEILDQLLEARKEAIDDATD